MLGPDDLTWRATEGEFRLDARIPSGFSIVFHLRDYTDQERFGASDDPGPRYGHRLHDPAGSGEHCSRIGAHRGDGDSERADRVRPWIDNGVDRCRLDPACGDRVPEPDCVRGERAVRRHLARRNIDRIRDELPIWSPDSSRIAFVRYAGAADAEIFVMDADGSNIVRITENEVDDADPRWSPNGTQLLYNSGSIDLNEQDVYLVTLADLGTRKLTSDGVNDSFGEWAPDGTGIAYASYRGDQWDVYVVTADGMATTQLTDDPADDFGPRWSPDGSQTLYVHGRLEGDPTRCT